MERNKCKNFLKRFLCLALALIVSMTSSNLDVMAVKLTGGGTGGSSVTGSHVKNYIGSGVMGYRMYLVYNSHGSIKTGGTSTKKIGGSSAKVLTVLGAENSLLSYNKKKTKQPYTLTSKKKYYSDLQKSIVGDIFYSLPKDRVDALETGVVVKKGSLEVDNNGKLYYSGNKTTKRKQGKTSAVVNSAISKLKSQGYKSSYFKCNFSINTLGLNESKNLDLSDVLGSKCNVTFTNYSSGKNGFGSGGGLTIDCKMLGYSGKKVNGSNRALVPAIETKFLVSAFNNLFGKGTQKDGDNVRLAFIKSMLSKSKGGVYSKVKSAYRNEKKCDKWDTYLLNHFSIVVEPVVTLSRGATSATMSFQDSKRYASAIDKYFYIGNQFWAIVSNMGLYGTKSINVKKNNLSNPFNAVEVKPNLTNGTNIPYGYSVFRSSRDIGDDIEDPTKSKITVTGSIKPEITVSATVSTLSRDINLVGASGGNVKTSEYLLLKMHRVDFVDINWVCGEDYNGEIIPAIKDRGVFVAMIPLNQLDGLSKQLLGSDAVISSSRKDWDIATDDNVNGVAYDKNFQAFCEELTTQCIKGNGRYVPANFSKCIVVGFNNPVDISRPESGVNLKFKVSGGNNGRVVTLSPNIDSILNGTDYNETKDVTIPEGQTLVPDSSSFNVKLAGDSKAYISQDSRIDITDVQDANVKYAFHDMKSAYRGVYLGFVGSYDESEVLGNKTKVDFTTGFSANEMNKLMYNLTNFTYNTRPLEGTSLTNNEIGNFINSSISLDRTSEVDSTIPNGMWSPIFLNDDLRLMFSSNTEADSFLREAGSYAVNNGEGVLSSYESASDYILVQETSHTSEFISPSVLAGAIIDNRFHVADDGIKLNKGVVAGTANTIGIGCLYRLYDSEAKNKKVDGSSITQISTFRSNAINKQLEDASYVDKTEHRQIYSCSTLSEKSNPNNSNSCEDAVRNISQANLADTTLCLEDNFVYRADEVSELTDSADEGEDYMFGDSCALDSSPFIIGISVKKDSQLFKEITTDSAITDDKGNVTGYNHSCHYKYNGTDYSHSIGTSTSCGGHSTFMNITVNFSLYDENGTELNKCGDFAQDWHSYSKFTLDSLTGIVKSNLRGGNFCNISIGSIKENGVSIGTMEPDGESASHSLYVAVYTDTEDEGSQEFKASYFNNFDGAKAKMIQENSYNDNDDDFDDADDEDIEWNAEDMGTQDEQSGDDGNIDTIVSYTLNDSSGKKDTQGVGRITEVHSHDYYSILNDDVSSTLTKPEGTTSIKSIKMNVGLYDKVYIYDEKITDDVNYLVFDYNGKNSDGRFTFNKDKSVVGKVSVTKSLNSYYSHSYNTSELPSENLSKNEGVGKAISENILNGNNSKDMNLAYVYIVPRVVTTELNGSSVCYANSVENVPYLPKGTKIRDSVKRGIDGLSSNSYTNLGEIDTTLRSILGSGASAEFGLRVGDFSPVFKSEDSSNVLASTSFLLSTWVGDDSVMPLNEDIKRKISLLSGQLKGYSIYYVYYNTKSGLDERGRYYNTEGNVTLKEYELNRVYDSIQSLTELKSNPLNLRKQVNNADVIFGVSSVDLNLCSDMIEADKSHTSLANSVYTCEEKSNYSGTPVNADGSVYVADKVLNTSYKVYDESVGTLTDANLNCNDLSRGNKYVLQTVNWFKQGVLRKDKGGLNINSAIPFVPDYSINLSRHFFEDTRVISAITGCEDYNSTTSSWLEDLLGLKAGIKPINTNGNVNLGMNNTTASKTVKLGDGTFGKKCKDAFIWTADWSSSLNGDSDLMNEAKKLGRVVELQQTYHFDFGFVKKNGDGNPTFIKIPNSSLNTTIPNWLYSVDCLKDADVDRDNYDSSRSLVANYSDGYVTEDTVGNKVYVADIIKRHDYYVAMFGRPAGTIFHVSGADNTTYKGVAINITEYAFRYNTIYQGNKFAKNTETPKNGILEFANKTGAKLDGVEISSGSKVTNHKLGNLNGYAYGYVNNDAKRGSVDIRMMFYPEVEMLAYSYNSSMYDYGANEKNLYNIDRIPDTQDMIDKMDINNSIVSVEPSDIAGWKGYLKLLTIGEELRKANTSELYVLSVKKGRKEGSFVDSDIKGKIASDGLAAGVGDAVSVGSGAGDLPTIYAGSDVVLQADSDFTINMAGYALDLINDDDTLIYEETDASGNKSLKTHSYAEIVKSGADIYTKWGNQTVGGKNKDNLFNNFTDWVKDNAVTEKFKVDAKLKVSNNVYSNFNISVGSVEPLTASDKRESISNNSYNVNAYTKKEYATGAYDIIKDKDILDKFASNKNTAETGCYQIKVSHGKIEKDDGGYIAMIKQLAVDYDFAKDYWSVDDEAYKKAEKIFEASGIYSSIFEAIESEDDESNKSCRVATYERDEDGNPVKEDSKLVYKEDCYDERGNFIGVDVSNEDILGNDEHWYDERVYTMVIRRFESRPFYLKDITLSDKIDYANATTNTKIHSQLKDANVGKWYFTVYLGDKDKSNSPFADYKETDDNYCGGTNGGVFPSISFFNPEAKNRESSLSSARNSGTVIMEDVWVDGADFRVPDATTGDMTAY